MMVSNKKLGKGLSSLLGNKEDLKVDNKKDNGLLLIPIERIFRDENQPRKEFDKEKIEELAQSINKNGLIQPLIVTKKDTENFTLVAGERRWRASQIANLKILPALLLPTDLDKDEISLIENIQRENLKVTEEAQAYQRLIEKEAREYFDTNVYKFNVPRNVTLSEAPSHGLPAIIYDLKCSGSQAYIALAKEFLERSNDGIQ